MNSKGAKKTTSSYTTGDPAQYAGQVSKWRSFQGAKLLLLLKEMSFQLNGLKSLSCCSDLIRFIELHKLN